jgi:Flp pilus assembly protein TadD
VVVSAARAVAAKAEALRLAGNTEFKAGQLQAALQQYSQAVQQLPSDALLYNNISLVQLKLGRVEQVRLLAVLHAAYWCEAQ